MVTKLITASDGSLWLSGRTGYTPVKKAEDKTKKEDQPVLLIPEEPVPAKPKHKTYKLHYTKPWEGTYGQFLNQFGNGYFSHGPNAKHYSEEQLGNMYIRYTGSEINYSQLWMYRIVNDKYYAIVCNVAGLLKPGYTGFKNIGVYYGYLNSKIDLMVSKGRGWPLSSVLTLPPEEKKVQKPKKVEEKKPERKCTDPDCDWCQGHSQKAENLPPTTPTSPGMVLCPLCLSTHQAFVCPMYGNMTKKWLWDLNSWKNHFCLRCGSMEHEKKDCDWVAPLACGICGNTTHATEHCPHNGGDNKFGLAAKGSINKPPWEKRGIKLDYMKPPDDKEWPELWPIENHEWDPLVQNARLIILEFIAENMRNATREAQFASMEDLDVRVIVQEARQRLDDLVTYVEPRLRAYTDMAVGGELRHHRAIGGRILPGPSSREMAWKSWKELRKILGPQGLLDAAILFEDFNDGGYGGVKWGIPAKILWMRETGKISGAIFLDRVFDLEHNGGAFLNKVKWRQEDRHLERFTGGRKSPGYHHYGIEYIKTWLGPAREKDEIDWPVILFFAPYEDRVLFREYWERSNRIWRETHLPPLPTPRTYEVPYGTSYMIRLSSVEVNKMKAPLKEFLPFIFEIKNDLGCTYCGDHNPGGKGKYKYYCEDGGCPLKALWVYEAGLGSPTFCSDHMTTCVLCGHILCPVHEYKYCVSCLPLKPNKTQLSDKYYKKGIK